LSLARIGAELNRKGAELLGEIESSFVTRLATGIGLVEWVETHSPPR
jgi:hypothetical protein